MKCYCLETKALYGINNYVHMYLILRVCAYLYNSSIPYSIIVLLGTVYCKAMYLVC